MRTKLLILAAACSLAASAQQVEITSRQQLLKGTESGICNPVLSADGQKLLFTHADYKGLKLYDFNSDVTTTIATDDMAGFHPSFSRDGKSVYFLSQTREDMRVYREVKAYNLEARTSMAVTEKARGMQAPVAVDGGFAAVSDNGRKLKADHKGGQPEGADGKQGYRKEKRPDDFVFNGQEYRTAHRNTESCHYRIKKGLQIGRAHV